MFGKYPDFLCIGAQKAGTTWLYRALKLHPDIWLPDRKEIHYFDRIFQPMPTRIVESENSLSIDKKQRSKRHWFKVKKERLSGYSVGRFLWECYYRFFPKNDTWYRRLFSPAGKRITGDFTPAYSLLDKKAVRKISEMMPETKVIFIMRDPIDRAWSNAKMILGQHGKRAANTIPMAEFVAYMASYESRARGQYSRIIDTWGEFFDRDNFLVLFFDQIRERPERLLIETTNFLGIDHGDKAMMSFSRKTIHKGQELEMPGDVHRYLFNIYEKELNSLVSQFGEIPQQWLYKSERALCKTAHYSSKAYKNSHLDFVTQC